MCLQARNLSSIFCFFLGLGSITFEVNLIESSQAESILNYTIEGYVMRSWNLKAGLELSWNLSNFGEAELEIG